MPTKVHDSLDEAYQALTDLEIKNDEKDIPCAIITVQGMSPIKIMMVSEYFYWYVLSPMRDRFLNYYANKYVKSKEKVEQKKLVEKLNNFVNEINSVEKPDDVARKSKTLSYLFEEEAIRYEFFRNLKKMKVISRFIGWKKYQRLVRPIDTITIFCYLWKFNFDGLKKKTLDLLKKMNLTSQGTKSDSLSVLSSSFDWDTYKKTLQEGSDRVTKKLASLPNSNN